MKAGRGGCAYFTASLRRQAGKGLALTFLLGSTLAGFLPAQELPVVHYGTSQGLPSVFILAVTQDELGRIWAAHHAGLSMYDGSRFQTWSRGEGLLDNSPYAVCADGRGSIWAAFPDRGIQYLTLEGRIVTVKSSIPLCQKDRITFLYRMRDGTIMAAGHQGYYRLTREGMAGPLYPLPGKKGRVTYALDTGGEYGILLACEEGLFSLTNTGAVLFPLPYETLGTRDICLIGRGHDETIYALARNGRLIRTSRNDSRVWNLASLSPPLTNAFFEMQTDAEGNLWIATGDGLFHLSGNALSLYTELHGLSNVWVNHVLVDRDGVLWLGTESGLDKISHFQFRNYCYRENVPVNSVWPILERPDGSVWIGTNTGILTVPPDGQACPIKKIEGMPETAIVDMKAGQDGKIWILSYDGVYGWNDSSFVSYAHNDFKQLALWTILPLKNNEVWVSTSNGIYVLDPKRRAFRPHELNERLEGVTDLNNLVSLPNGDVILLGRKIHHWRTDGRIEEVRLPAWASNYSLYDIVEDEGQTWVLADEGLLRREGGQWTRYPLAGKKAFDMVKVHPREFWIGCSSGIAYFDGERFEYFGLQDGVSVEECNSGSKLLDSRGRVWLGGKNITVITPGLRKDPVIGTPLITRAETGSRVYVLPRSIEMDSRVRSLEIQYATPTFINEHKIVHRTRMSPLERDYSPPTREKSIHYANLAPGRYTFMVQAGWENNLWESAPATLLLTVKPTFWQTIIARVVLLLMLVAGGILLASARVRFLEKQRIKLQKIVEHQTSEIKTQRDELARLATLDPLTNLANRRKFLESLEAERARSMRSLRPLSLVMMDIDHFKPVNDTHGHAAGDEVLKGIAQRGIRSVRGTDILARWGGDEFVLLMPETNLEEARETAQRVKNEMQATAFDLPSGSSLTITLSMGVVSWRVGEGGTRTSESLLQEADALLYRAKDSGRDRIE